MLDQKDLSRESANRPINIFETESDNRLSEKSMGLESFFKDNHVNGLPEVIGSTANSTCFSELMWNQDLAELSFTPGRIYASGGRYYGIYKRISSDRYNTCGKVDIAEVDPQGRKISDLELRYVYKTKSGKEYVYGISDHRWKIYTNNVVIGLIPEHMDIYGKIRD